MRGQCYAADGQGPYSLHRETDLHSLGFSGSSHRLLRIVCHSKLH